MQSLYVKYHQKYHNVCLTVCKSVRACLLTHLVQVTCTPRQAFAGWAGEKSLQKVGCTLVDVFPVLWAFLCKRLQRLHNTATRSKETQKKNTEIEQKIHQPKNKRFLCDCSTGLFFVSVNGDETTNVQL